MGQVCKKHDEFYETECRWCEEPLDPLPPPPAEPQKKTILDLWRAQTPSEAGAIWAELYPQKK